MSTNPDRKFVENVDMDICCGFYCKKKNQVAPISQQQSISNTNLQLQHPIRFTRKLYNPNIDLINKIQSQLDMQPDLSKKFHDEFMKNSKMILQESPGGNEPSNNGCIVVPLLNRQRCNQLIKSREEVTQQDRITHQKKLTINSLDLPTPLSKLLKFNAMNRRKREISNMIVESKNNNTTDKKHIRNQDQAKPDLDFAYTPVGLAMPTHMVCSSLEGNPISNLTSNYIRDFDDAFINHIHYLMSFKNINCDKSKVRFDFSIIQDDQNSIFVEAEPISHVILESSSDYQPLPVSSANFVCPGHSNPRLPGEARPSWSTIPSLISNNNDPSYYSV